MAKVEVSTTSATTVGSQVIRPSSVMQRVEKRKERERRETAKVGMTEKVGQSHKTHSCSTVCRLAQELHSPSLCAMSHQWLFLSRAFPPWALPLLHLPTLPHTEKHQVHPAHLQAHSVAKLSHQEITLAWRPAEWRKAANHNSHRLWAQRACGPSSRIDAYSGDPYQLDDVQEKFGEEDHRSPITEEVEDFLKRLGLLACWILNYQRRPTSNRRCILDDSVESLADSDLEDGELQKCWLHLCMPRKLGGNPMQWSM